MGTCFAVTFQMSASRCATWLGLGVRAQGIWNVTAKHVNVTAKHMSLGVRG